MMKFKFSFSLALILFFSCALTDQGIFSSIEHETKNVNTGLPDNLTVTKIGQVSSYIFAGSSTVYYKSAALVTIPSDTSQWNAVTTPSGYSYCISMDIDPINNIVYGLFINDSSGRRDIFYTKPSTSLSWLPASVTNTLAGTNVYFDEIQVLGTQLFVKYRYDTSTTGVYYRGITSASLNASATFTFSNNYLSTAAPLNISYLTPGTYMGSNGNYYFSDGNNVFYGAANSQFLKIAYFANNNPLSGGEYIQVIGNFKNAFFNDIANSLIILGTNKGKIFSSTDGTSFNVSTITNNGGDLNIQSFGSFLTSANNYLLLIGTQTSGFFELDCTGVNLTTQIPTADLPYPSLTASQSNYQSQVIHYSPVYSFFQIPSTNFLLVGTYSQGVWKNYDTSGNNNWNRE